MKSGNAGQKRPFLSSVLLSPLQLLKILIFLSVSSNNGYIVDVELESWGYDFINVTPRAEHGNNFSLD